MQTTRKVIDLLGGRARVLERLRSGNLDLDDDQRRMIEQALPDELRPELHRTMLAQLDDARHRIVDETFPVGLPLATLLPFFVDVEQAAADDDVLGLFKRSLTIHPEDVRLFAAHLDEWLSNAIIEGNKDAKTVMTVRSQVDGEYLDALMPALMFSCLKRFNYSCLEGEPAPDTLEETRAPAFLEAHAGFLEERGYPALAARFRDEP